MLTKIWNFFFYACKHDWKIIGTNDVTDINYHKIGTKYHLQCKKCGNVKRKIL